jgi:hypothetical protein
MQCIVYGQNPLEQFWYGLDFKHSKLLIRIAKREIIHVVLFKEIQSLEK